MRERQRCRERQAAEDKSWWGFRHAWGVTPTRMRGSVRAGKGPGQVGPLQGLNTRPPEGHFEDTHTSGQREEMGRVVASLYGRTADLGVASPQRPPTHVLESEAPDLRTQS